MRQTVNRFERYGICLSTLASLWVLATACCAQDPFAAGDSGVANVFGESPTADSGLGAFAEPKRDSTAQPSTTAYRPDLEPDPVVRLLRTSPPKTPSQWADALTWMTRIKRWDEVKRLLNELAAANWDVSRQAELARAGGSALWLRMRVDEAELTVEQIQLLRDILAAPGKLARDLNALDKWIDQLASPKAGERKLAEFRLQDGSMIAVQRLVDRLLDGDDRVAPALLAQAVVSFGTDGKDALRAACHVRDPQRAARVVLALAELPDARDFSVELGSAFYSLTFPESEKSRLSEILSAKHGSLPSAAAVHAFVEKKFDEALAEYQIRRSGGSSLPTILWRLSPDRQTIQLVEATMTEKVLERLTQLAAFQAGLAEANRDDLIESSVVLMQQAYGDEPALGDTQVESRLMVALDGNLVKEAAYWEQVFAKADEWQMHGAAIRAIEQIVDHAQDAEFGWPLDFLSKLLSDPRPVIRYTALQGIASLDPKQNYAGAETAIEVALEMTDLAGGPHALVIGLHSDVRSTAAQLLAQRLGGDVTEANSARAALKALDGGLPIELIVVVDRVSDQSIYELLQRLRKSKKGQQLPIAVLTDNLFEYERTLIAQMAGAFTGVLSRDPDQVDRIVKQLLEQLDTDPITESERSSFVQAAGRFLETIASDSSVYSFYPLSDWSERLVQIPGGLTPTEQIQVLSAVGSMEAQQKLVALAAASGLSEAEREAAARAFGKSVRSFGTLLGRSDLVQAYDLYNTLGPANPASVNSLGLVLDIIEARAGQKEWPAGM